MFISRKYTLQHKLLGLLIDNNTAIKNANPIRSYRSEELSSSATDLISTLNISNEELTFILADLIKEELVTIGKKPDGKYIATTPNAYNEYQGKRRLTLATKSCIEFWKDRIAILAFIIAVLAFVLSVFNTCNTYKNQQQELQTQKPPQDTLKKSKS